MPRQYHYLVAGLPDLMQDDQKIPMSTVQFRELLQGNMPENEFALIRSFFWRYDNQNLMARLQNPESDVDPLGNLSSADLDELLAAVKEGSFSGSSVLPQYLATFISAYTNDTSLIENKRWELQLSELYYEHLVSEANDFVRNWYMFERDLSNILTAFNCRNHEIPVENQIIGKNELSEKLVKSNARDFGIDKDFPRIEQILKALDETDLLEQEKLIDRIKWEYLDEAVFFYYFTIERLFSFLIKLSIVERWMVLDKPTGQQLFNELINNLESSYAFPDEFKLKK